VILAHAIAIDNEEVPIPSGIAYLPAIQKSGRFNSGCTSKTPSMTRKARIDFFAEYF